MHTNFDHPKLTPGTSLINNDLGKKRILNKFGIHKQKEKKIVLRKAYADRMRNMTP
jgi:hypothetical protein